MIGHRLRLSALLLVILIICRVANPQQKKSAESPDSGATAAAGVYTNKFFGMTYRYPADWRVQPNFPPKNGTTPKVFRLLFLTLPAKQIELTALAITARVPSSPAQTAREYLDEENRNRSVEPLNPPRDVVLGKMPFLRFDAMQKTKTVSVHIAELVSIQKGYALEFYFLDQAKKSRIAEFDRTLDSIEFSEP